MLCLADLVVVSLISLICASDLSATINATTQEEFAQETLRLHNLLRAKHGVPPLKLDAKVSKYAQRWANNLAEKDEFEHSDNPFGENLFWGSKSMSAKAMTDSWYKEGEGYNYSVDPIKAGIFPDVGHFTQLVWKSSKTIGVGRAFTKSGAMIGVANYSPDGNYVGEFLENVLPPKKQ